MEPSVPVITWLTVPIEVPLLLLTVRPVVRPGRVLLDTEPRASTLLLFAWLIPVADAFAGPSLCSVACELTLAEVPTVADGIVMLWPRAPAPAPTPVGGPIVFP
jgi:hypothetical protein